MNNPIKNISLLVIVCLLFNGNAMYAQTAQSLLRKSNKLEAVSKLEDSLHKQFDQKNFQWPPEQLYIRSFKYDRLLEIWIKDICNPQYKLFKSYKICMQSGTLGPKRLEGDFQMPEGFYYINDFNANSNFHLSLGLNYPNASDKVLSDSLRPGNDIYIHGHCVSAGCIAIEDKPIEELFLLTSLAKDNGQEFIPVHVFPVKFDVKKSFEYLATTTKNNQPLQKFCISLKAVFDFFEAKKQLPIILVNKNGDYLVN